MSHKDTIKLLLENVPDPNCVRYNPKTGLLLYSFRVEYKALGKVHEFVIWEEGFEEAERALEEMRGSLTLVGKIKAQG